jgi:hypothetical protein
VTLKKGGLEQGEGTQPGEELAEQIQCVTEEWEGAYRRYLAKRESPAIHQRPTERRRAISELRRLTPQAQFPLITPLLHAEPERCSPGTPPVWPSP